jgi:hypothetical protein
MILHLLLPWVLLLFPAQDSPAVAVTSPVADEVLRGTVTVTGRLDIVSFTSARLEFAYAVNPTDTWFPIQMYSQPVTGSTLATWDTTSITDGSYVLRLRVALEDGTVQQASVPIQIGNDFLPTATPEPSSTPEPETFLLPTPFLLAASPTPTAVPRATPTALAPNLVVLEQSEIYGSLGRGALVILGLFALAGLILRVRRY